LCDANAYAQSYPDSNGYTDCNSDADSYANSDRDTYPNTYSYADRHANRHAHGNSNRHAHGNSNSHADANSSSYSYANGDSYSSASYTYSDGAASTNPRAQRDAARNAASSTLGPRPLAVYLQALAKLAGACDSLHPPVNPS
jgi:hypothetical protein